MKEMELRFDRRLRRFESIDARALASNRGKMLFELTAAWNRRPVAEDNGRTATNECSPNHSGWQEPPALYVPTEPAWPTISKPSKAKDNVRGRFADLKAILDFTQGGPDSCRNRSLADPLPRHQRRHGADRVRRTGPTSRNEPAQRKGAAANTSFGSS